MRIKVHDGRDFKMNLAIPTGLALNRVTAAFVPKLMEQNGLSITYDQAMDFIRALKAYKKSHPDWCLVEVQSKDGEYVMIKL